MRLLLAAVALALNTGVVGAAPLELPESVRTALASARAAQKEHRNEDAILAARAGLARSLGDPVVQTWHLAWLLRSMAEAYEQAGSLELAARTMALASVAAQAAPAKHDDLRRWIAAEAALKLRRAGALGAAREHMEFALRDLVPFLEQADPEARVPAIETLIDDVRLAIDEGNHDGARASLALATFLANLYRIDLSEFEKDANELLELLDPGAGDDAAVRIRHPGQSKWLRGAT